MYLTGTESDDTLVGGTDDDTVLGLGGDDLLIGGAGHNTLDGGAGSDTVSYADAAPAPMFSFLMINLSGQYVSIIGPTPEALDTLASIENAVGSSGMDWLVGGAGDNHLSGGAGNDQLNGGGGADVLDGGAGDDTLATDIGVTSLQPGSLMLGGDGADSFRSGNSSDAMYGDAGNDSFQIQNYATSRIVDGGADVDTIEFGGGFTPYAAGVVFDLAVTTAQTIATDVVLTASNVESVTGSSSSDVLFGDANANVLSGGAGGDQLHGRDGNDVLQGGDGDDLLDGGAGSDQLTGGAGADTFFFGQTDGAMDFITDFTTSDHIQFDDSPAGSASNYVETTDMNLVASLFAGNGVRYVAVDLGGSVVLFADLGDEGTTYDQTIFLTGASLSSIDAGSLLAL